jgi:hypothetical protein
VHLLQFAQGLWHTDARQALEDEADALAMRWLPARMPRWPMMTARYCARLDADYAAADHHERQPSADGNCHMQTSERWPIVRDAWRSSASATSGAPSSSGLWRLLFGQ